MLHPNTELRKRDDRVGYGVFATAPIPMGTITWVRDPLDQILDLARVSLLHPKLIPFLVKYSYVNGQGERVLCWDLTRFMNHSCEPNALSPGLPLEIAVRDIAPGEELTNDYGSLNIEEHFTCACGAPSCREIVRDDDFESLAPEWDQLLLHSAARTPWVPQPLGHLLHEEHGLLDRYRFPDPLPSILLNRWRDVGRETSLAGPARFLR